MRGGRETFLYLNELCGLISFLSNQLRNLVWATSKHDVYLVNDQSVVHWSAMLKKEKKVLDVSGQLAAPSNNARVKINYLPFFSCG